MDMVSHNGNIRHCAQPMVGIWARTRRNDLCNCKLYRHWTCINVNGARLLVGYANGYLDYIRRNANGAMAKIIISVRFRVTVRVRVRLISPLRHLHCAKYRKPMQTCVY